MTEQFSSNSIKIIEEVVRDYDRNMILLDISKKYKISRPTIRKMIIFYGRKLRHPPFNKKVTSKEIINCYKNIGNIAEVGRRKNITKQRVYQILIKNNIKCGHKKNEYKVEAAAKRKQISNIIKILSKHITYNKHCNKWGKALIMWNENKSINEIAKEYNCSCNKLSWYIYQMRTRHGWFPKRKRWNSLRTNNLKIKYNSIMKLINKGYSKKQISKVLHIKHKTICYIIKKNRTCV